MITDSTMLVGKCVSLTDMQTTGGIILNRGVEGYKFEFVDMTSKEYMNGSIDEIGVHINHTPDERVPTYICKDGEIIPIDNNYLLVGKDSHFYHIVCGICICFVAKHSKLTYNISRDLENCSNEELVEYMNYYIECDDCDYVCDRIANFEAANHSESLYEFDDNQDNRSSITPFVDVYPVFHANDIALLKEVLVQNTRNKANYRFIYVDDWGIESYFEYKWHNNSLVLYFVYITNDELMAECDYTFWGKGLTLYLTGAKNNREKLSITANDVSIFEVAAFKYFGIKANSVSASNKSISPIMLYDIDEFEVTASSIDTGVAEIKSGNHISKVNHVNINI